MPMAWCPRCQQQVRVRARQVKVARRREVRTETLCAECGILLKAETVRQASAPAAPRHRSGGA